MFRLIGKPADSRIDIGRAQFCQTRAIPTRDQFGEGGSGGYRGRAAANLEPGADYAPIFEERRQPQNVAANRIGDLNRDGGRGQFADITGIPEVLDQFGDSRYQDMTTVAAGVLVRDNRILICRRRADQPHALKWEFPGGKLEPGETPEQALVRELREELTIESTAGRELMRYEYAYPGKNPIQLIFLEVTEWAGEIENRIFESIVWESREVLAEYDFLEGDLRFLTCLRS